MSRVEGNKKAGSSPAFLFGATAYIAAAAPAAPALLALRRELDLRRELLRAVFLRVVFFRAPPLRAALRAPPLRAVFLRAPAFLRPPFLAAAMIASPIGVHIPGVPPVGRLGTARGLELAARAVTNSAHFALYEFVTTREYRYHVFARQCFSYRFRKCQFQNRLPNQSY